MNGNWVRNKWRNTKKFSCFSIKMRMELLLFQKLTWLWKVWVNGLQVTFRLKIRSKFGQNSVNIQLKLSRNSAYIQSKFGQNSVKIRSKFGQNSVKIQSKFSQNSVKIRCKNRDKNGQNPVKIRSKSGLFWAIFTRSWILRGFISEFWNCEIKN